MRKLNRDIETVKNEDSRVEKYNKLKCIGEINRRFKMVEEWICELQDRATEII